MIVLVIRKSDNEVMPLRQDSPNHRPGRMTQLTIEKYGGTPSDYIEYLVPAKDRNAVIRAKELVYNHRKEQVDITPHSPEEQQLRQKEPELESVEDDLIKMHLWETAALDLGIKANRYTARKTALQNRAEKLRKDIEGLKNKE